MEKTQEMPGRRLPAPKGEKMILHKFTIQPRHMALLKERAAARRVPLSVILREVLDEWVEKQDAADSAELTEGARLVAELTANGLIGMWADRTDIGDSVEFARRLRERAQTRADRFDVDEIERLGGAHPAGPAGG
jgi:hypothetical protein